MCRTITHGEQDILNTQVSISSLAKTTRTTGGGEPLPRAPRSASRPSVFKMESTAAEANDARTTDSFVYLSNYQYARAHVRARVFHDPVVFPRHTNNCTPTLLL